MEIFRQIKYVKQAEKTKILTVPSASHSKELSSRVFIKRK